MKNDLKTFILANYSLSANFRTYNEKQYEEYFSFNYSLSIEFYILNKKNLKTKTYLMIGFLKMNYEWKDCTLNYSSAEQYLTSNYFILLLTCSDNRFNIENETVWKIIYCKLRNVFANKDDDS